VDPSLARVRSFANGPRRALGAQHGCGLLHRRDHLGVSRAPAQVAGDRITDLLPRGVGTRVEQRLCRKNDAGPAESALQRGVILAAKELLDENPEPTIDEIRDALAGNLCRCTGYTKMIAAVKEAAAVLHTERAARTDRK